MRIDHFRAHNYMVHRTVALAIPAGASVALVCGGNGIGKTSLLEGIRLALLGDFPDRGIEFKKDLPRLITEGEKDGFVEVGLDGASYKLSLKTGNHGSSGPPPFEAHVSAPLDPAAFIALPPAQRRKILFDAAGVQIRVDDVVAKLIAQEHAKSLVDSLRPDIALGLDKAAAKAKTRASEARGGWSAVTGENYGSSKALAWEAPTPELERPVEDLRADYEDAQAAHGLALNARDSLRAATNAAARRAELAAKAGKVKTLTTAIEESTRRIAELEHIAGEHIGECPNCGIELGKDKEGLFEWEAEKVVDVAGAAKDLEREKERLAQLKSSLAGAEAAAVALESLPAAPAKEELDAAERAVTLAHAALDVARDAWDKGRRDAEDAASARQRTEKAARYYGEATGYAALEKALDALPAEYLGEAMTKINGRLARISAAFDAPVTLKPDMTLTYNGFPYPQLSRSQQIRVQLAIGLALAYDGGIAMVDEFDLIAPPKRGAILRALTNPEVTGSAQLILGATLKEEPKLPAPFHIVWLGGV
ncbi:MAG TPA: AAA family ATPase [Lysobacter sp.]|nr:AAA family ATPase [Lysobacter sp.]